MVEFIEEDDDLVDAPWFSSETLALYKSLTYLLTSLYYYISYNFAELCANYLSAVWNENTL